MKPINVPLKKQMKESIYYLLGHIDNYSGGFSLKGGIFKSISYLGSDWKIDNEKIQKSNRLIKWCEVVLDEHQLSNDIRIEKWKEDKGITIFSMNIVGLIEKFITGRSNYFGRDRLEIKKEIFVELDIRNTKSSSYKQHLNFLHGVIDSNGVKNKFYFYNGHDKCLLTEYVLRCFADEDDEITIQSYFKTPCTDKLTVNEEGTIWNSIIKKYCN